MYCDDVWVSLRRPWDRKVVGVGFVLLSLDCVVGVASRNTMRRALDTGSSQSFGTLERVNKLR